MEKKLAIYKPYYYIELDKKLVVLLFLWFVPFVLGFLSTLYPSYKDEIQLWIILLALISFLYTIYFIIGNFFWLEATNGDYVGFLRIYDDKIICNDEVFTIYEIRKIEILVNYIQGERVWNISAWRRKKSNGVKNYIKIHKNNKEVYKYFFLQTKEDNIQMFLDSLEIYYKRDILCTQNYKNIVNLKV